MVSGKVPPASELSVVWLLVSAGAVRLGAPVAFAEINKKFGLVQVAGVPRTPFPGSVALHAVRTVVPSVTFSISVACAGAASASPAAAAPHAKIRGRLVTRLSTASPARFPPASQRRQPGQRGAEQRQGGGLGHRRRTLLGARRSAIVKRHLRGGRRRPARVATPGGVEKREDHAAYRQFAQIGAELRP